MFSPKGSQIFREVRPVIVTESKTPSFVDVRVPILLPCRKDLRDRIMQKMAFHSCQDPTNDINVREADLRCFRT
jgi:hypothetical protein